ncbi:MAG: hypothetical protein K2N66_01885, partial [Paramuribaculum sp.]|nr:hypothetical protein [Paramuribaculum sp.]
ILPPIFVRESIETVYTKEDITSQLGLGEAIATIDLNGSDARLSVTTEESLTAVEISVPASDYIFNAETGTLTLNADFSGHINIKMPQSSLLSVTGVTPDASVYITGIDTPILTLDAMPGIFNIERSVINTLVIGGATACDTDKKGQITVSGNSDIDAIVTASDEQPSLVVITSRVGTSVTL